MSTNRFCGADEGAVQGAVQGTDVSDIAPVGEQAGLFVCQGHAGADVVGGDEDHVVDLLKFFDAGWDVDRKPCR